MCLFMSIDRPSFPHTLHILPRTRLFPVGNMFRLVSIIDLTVSSSCCKSPETIIGIGDSLFSTLFNSSLWTHYPRCKYSLDNCSSVLNDHIERLLGRCPRVFLPPTAFLSLLGRPISDALNRFCAWCALRVGWVSICLSMHR